ncbi:prepilin-type N-terminal cleavage/methylation domain-containing protein [Paracraurococcus lichenis]|uniref:Prepilin-type N-terminal cleavage/methylation domain-containing protein n=1 Tax=Paracraurococcus lichenis TaxID=3064888 RepID=A0ABT9E819_9PROT|nr:prepilin-type N-terminal cleavage/methylation domain-containing protein [Paracraurococcus sp. LOR1-02]MDO9712291.1 prepilin-type N-terminal cleavage/methylation domain-containing protein [Paracraurococcus sp. LOR1-02]
MRAERQAGFTLLEAMVAFAIAAIALAALLQGGLLGLRSTQIAGRTEEALARARSRLAALEGRPVTAMDQRGEDGGGFSWRLRVVPEASAGGVTLYAVSVAVGWRDGGEAREVRLETQRLGVTAAR